MRGGKYYLSIAKNDPSTKHAPKLPSSQPKEIGRTNRKTKKRPNNFKSDVWYEKAALSMAISDNHQQGQ